MKIIHHIIICCLFGFAIVCPANGLADRIILKDGSIETSHRIWESERYIHFILQGTNDVEIRYAKEIVERIERQNPEDRPSEGHKVEGAEPARETKQGTEKSSSMDPKSESGGLSSATAGKPLESLRGLIEQNRGITFYDPRRPKRYWAMHNSKHNKLVAALDAMSKPYHRSAQWVETHMGQENDLGIIHENLTRQFQREDVGEGEAQAQTSKERKSVASAAKAETRIPTAPNVEPRQLPANQTNKSSGIRFYDPRRKHKYWSGSKKHHHTLHEALDALARQYDVTSVWIESNMGDTNDLSIIHQTIQRNIQR